MQTKCFKAKALTRPIKQSMKEIPVSDRARVRHSYAVQSLIPGWLYTVPTSILNVPMQVPRNGIFFE